MGNSRLLGPGQFGTIRYGGRPEVVVLIAVATLALVLLGFQVIRKVNDRRVRPKGNAYFDRDAARYGFPGSMTSPVLDTSRPGTPVRSSRPPVAPSFTAPRTTVGPSARAHPPVVPPLTTGRPPGLSTIATRPAAGAPGCADPPTPVPALKPKGRLPADVPPMPPPPPATGH